VQFSLLLSIALVVMVIFLFLRRFWPTFIASITVPLACPAPSPSCTLCHYSIDNLSLMAVTISVGFVVDDAIVVIENIHRFIEGGRRCGGLQGARQIGFTVISMSTSLVAVFIPLLFMGGLIGRLFHEFAVTVSLAILVSGVISLTLTPMLCSRFLKPEAAYRKPGIFYRACEQSSTGCWATMKQGCDGSCATTAFMLGVAFLTLVATVPLSMPCPRASSPSRIPASSWARPTPPRTSPFCDGRAAAEGRPDRARRSGGATLGSFIGAGGAGGRQQRPHVHHPQTAGGRNASATRSSPACARKLAGVPASPLFLQASQDIRVGGRMSRAQFQYALQSGDLDELNRWSTLLVDKLRRLAGTARRQQRPADRGLQPWWSLTATPPRAWASRPSPLTTPSTTPSASARSRPCIGNTTSST
jgi:multidrug efflux pump subunit AcrB